MENYKKYYLLIRTAQAEFRAWEKLEEKNKDNITPMIELTRGRKKIQKKENEIINNESDYRSLDQYNFYDNHLNKAKNIVNNLPSFIDITKEETLMCGELYPLIDFKNGYENWINFLQDNFKKENVYPVLQITDKVTDYNNYTKNLRKQFESLSKSYNTIGYRAEVLTDGGFLKDLNILSTYIIKHIGNNKNFFLIFDHTDIRPKTYSLHADATDRVITLILEKIPEIKIIILSNSFPKSVNEVLNKDIDSISSEEILLFKEIIKKSFYKDNIFYGDYGSISSIRNDEAIIARGWIPRIDIPKQDSINCYKAKREMKDGKQIHPYSYYYSDLAKKILNDKDLFNAIPESWAKEEIKNAAKGEVSNSIPNFWISIRMQLYIINIINQLTNIYNI